MDRTRKLELIQRSLGLRHKLKVHESMKPPETHDDLAVMLLAKWELEDELKAIEEILTEARQSHTKEIREIISKAIGAKNSASIKTSIKTAIKKKASSEPRSLE